MSDTPKRLTDIPTKLSGSMIRHFLKNRYRKTLLRLCKGEKELPEGSARARVVILHGYSKHSDTPDMQNFRHILQRDGKCDLFYCDMPYHGLSVPEGKEYLRGKIRFFSRLVEAAYALTLRALSRPYVKPIPTFVVCYSAGGIAFLRFIQENPALQKYIAGACTMALPLRVDHNAGAKIQKWKPYIEGVARWASYLPYLADIPVGDIGVGDLEDKLEFNEKIDLRSAMEMHVASIEAKRALPIVTMPWLFLHGAKDRTAPVGDVRDAVGLIKTPIEKKKLIVYPNAEHGLLDGKDGRVDVAHDFLKWMNEIIEHNAWEHVEYENMADEAMELTSDTYFFISKRIVQIRKILLRWWRKITFQS
ncbi:MAG: hypothetical protein UY04_C0005G0005 [Parcubacteria group bacterium GW2011_GWA2_47_7]|nr:MAG: hypothetical protein UY04_C0005G0005 [Parcubacteria group bacterium GW2011_GWA2_47_7]